MWFSDGYAPCFLIFLYYSGFSLSQGSIPNSISTLEFGVIALGLNKATALYLVCSYLFSKASLWWQILYLCFPFSPIDTLYLCSVEKPKCQGIWKAEILKYFYQSITDVGGRGFPNKHSWGKGKGCIASLLHFSPDKVRWMLCDMLQAVTELHWQVAGARGGL